MGGCLGKHSSKAIEREEKDYPKSGARIGNMSVGGAVSIKSATGGGVAFGNTNIGGSVPAGGSVAFGNTYMSAGVPIEGGSSIGNTTFRGGISVDNSAPDVKSKADTGVPNI